MLLAKATELRIQTRLCYFALIGPDASSGAGGNEIGGIGCA
jgi:hypothetical protein